MLWGAGDLVGLVVFGVLFVNGCGRQREAAREDRQLDREEARGACGR